jgi:hypothetical protein
VKPWKQQLSALLLGPFSTDDGEKRLARILRVARVVFDDWVEGRLEPSPAYAGMIADVAGRYLREGKL